MNIRAAVEISKTAMRARAVEFAAEHANDTSEAADRQTFWNDFFSIFEVKRRQVAAFEELAKRASTANRGWIDLLYPGEMAVEHKSLGEDLNGAMVQLLDYLPSLSRQVHPWLLVVCDFQRFVWHNLDTGARGEFKLSELPDNLDLFRWIAGHERPGERFATEEAANFKATQLLAAVHDQLEATGYDVHALRQWITRILFCLFADDAGIWDRAHLHTYLAKSTRTDGNDLGRTLAEVFEVLNTPPERRATNLDEDLAEFAYINGELFADPLPIPSCTEAIRASLLDACRFNWAAISPAIFGSLFQNVMTPKERRNLGAHYTTEKNILRTIGPLFLDDLKSELAAATTRKSLTDFHAKLGKLTFFDPACGCGNFLVVAYRELRLLETECLRRLNEKDRRSGQRTMNLELLCKVNVSQFYGIECEEFPALIARTALYLADHLANREVSLEFGEHFLRFPIPSAPHIVIGNALGINWASVLPPERADYVFGNPPFVGRQFRNASQRQDMSAVFGNARGHAVLDYVACWFKIAAGYVSGSRCRVAFVSTNSISQGENVAALWPHLRAAGVVYEFAHRTFAWSSDALGQAHVHVVIIGFAHASVARPVGRIFEYADSSGEPTEIAAPNISPYLTDGPALVVEKRSRPVCTWSPPATYGCTANDGGHLLINEDSIAEARADPVAAKYLRLYLGATEVINGTKRWVVWLEDATPTELQSSPFLMKRIEAVQRVRLASERVGTRAAAATPALLMERRQQTERFLFVPCVSSHHRSYAPIVFFDRDVLVRASSWCIPGADLTLFGVLSSQMFMAWVRTVGGRMKSDYQISPTTVYNNFPMPGRSPRIVEQIERGADAVLKARAGHSDVTLSDLYDPRTMPADLLAAHRALDKAVDAAYGRHKHTGDASRLAVLFRRYVELSGGDAELFAAD